MIALMKSICFSFIILASFTALFSVADARRFYIGGNGAWVIHPNESYFTWSARNRFQVNDTLYFTYAKGSDSVQLVTKADFDSCNIKNPLEKFDNGETEVTLNRSGSFYFISGDRDHCTMGQKLTVVVLSLRNHPNVPISPAKAPSTAHSPVSPAKDPSKAQPPKSPSPVSLISPVTTPPKSSVSPAPEMNPPNINAPATSPKNAASGVTVSSVTTTVLSVVALTVVMFA